MMGEQKEGACWGVVGKNGGPCADSRPTEAAESLPQLLGGMAGRGRGRDAAARAWEVVVDLDVAGDGLGSRALCVRDPGVLLGRAREGVVR